MSDVRLRSSTSSNQQQRGQQNYRCDDEQKQNTMSFNTLSFRFNLSTSRSNRANHHQNNNNNEQNVSHPSLPKVRVKTATPMSLSSKYIFSFFSTLLIMGSMFSVLLQIKYYAEIVVRKNGIKLNHIDHPLDHLPTSSTIRRTEVEMNIKLLATQHFPRIILVSLIKALETCSA